MRTRLVSSSPRTIPAASILACCLVIVMIADSTPAAESTDWPAWRGPRANGHADGRQVPLRWSENENVVWKAAVPGRGHSSPIVVGDQIFLTTADESGEKQLLLAFDRASGEQQWSCVIHSGGLMHTHSKNSHASATPACNGRMIYTAFINGNALRVTAVDLQGRIVWQSAAGKFTSEHGYGSSPVLYNSLVIVNGDNLTDSFLAALDQETGEETWFAKTKTTGNHGGFGTPIVEHIAGKDQLLLMGIKNTASYDPNTGKRIWTCAGPAEVNACTVAVHNDLVIASGGYPEKEIMAIRADGQGDVSRSHVVWRETDNVTYVPSPIVHEGKLYTVNDGGVATCRDAETGRPVWRGRLGAKFSASPTLAAGHLFVPDESGTTHVLEAGPRFKVVAKNSLGDGGFATPTIVDSHIFLRTNHYLYCIAQR